MPRSHRNYKTGDEAKVVDGVGDAEDEIVYPTTSKEVKNDNELPVTKSLLPLNGKPFSAVHNGVLPKYFDEPPENFDEFGFRIEPTEDEGDKFGPLEDPQYRMKWLAHLQFKNSNLDKELTWGNIDIKSLYDTKTTDLIKEQGIPHSMRAHLWPRFCEATVSRNSNAYRYEQICQEADAEILSAMTQIERDLLRTMPNNRCFSKLDALGVEAMRRILRAVAFFYPDLGYCQGMGTVVATLLLVCDEESVFWIMCKLIEHYLPTSFYGDDLLGLQSEVKVLEHLIEVHMPGVSEKCRNSDTEISIVLANWLLTLASSVFPMRILLRVWDLMFQQGISALYRALISIFKINEELILNSELEERPTGVFSFIQNMPASVHNVDYLVELMTTFEFSITDHTIISLRKTYQGSLMSQQGMNYQMDMTQLKQRTNPRKLKPTKSFIGGLFKSTEVMEDDPKTKNVRVTELIIDLKNAINQICNHFRACPQKHEVSVQADYSSMNKIDDRDEFSQVRRLAQKHARALIDFQGKDQDELTFKRNDIIAIVSEKDEHCWIGELNGSKGWFPAKFVKIVEEKGKLYCPFGDETIAPKIGELIRNSFASAFLAIFYYGLRPSGIIVNAHQTHPWHFIETFASSLMEAHNNTTHSKLSLCDAFSLDKDGKRVLSPEEVLFRAVHFIGETHAAKFVTNDVRFRSLIVCGLNEQCLHLWFEIFCNNAEQESLRQNYYQNYAFVRSPVWRQLKSELKLLCQFCFNLNLNFELEQIYAIEKIRASQTNKNQPVPLTKIARSIGPLELSFTKAGCGSSSPPLKEEVRNMLIKHNLFSWDL